MPCGGQLILRALHIKWVQCSGLSSRLAIWNFATTCRQDIPNTALNISIFLILLNININILQQLAAKIFIILISISPSRQRESFESLDKSYTGTEVEHGKFVRNMISRRSRASSFKTRRRDWLACVCYSVSHEGVNYAERFPSQNSNSLR